MRQLLQYIEEAKTRDEAKSYLDWLATQDGYLGGRVIGDGHIKPFAAQAFFADETIGADWLPFGVRRVLVPESIVHACGIK